MLTNPTAITGKEGEDRAVAWLRDNGFLLRDRNWRQGHYEIDIVAEQHGITHFIEVKTRRAGSLCSPEQSITPTKQRAMRQAATAYIAQHRIIGDIAFDLIAIDKFPDGNMDLRFIPDIVEISW